MVTLISLCTIGCDDRLVGGKCLIVVLTSSALSRIGKCQVNTRRVELNQIICGIIYSKNHERVATVQKMEDPNIVVAVIAFK